MQYVIADDRGHALHTEGRFFSMWDDRIIVFSDKHQADAYIAQNFNPRRFAAVEYPEAS